MDEQRVFCINRLFGCRKAIFIEDLEEHIRKCIYKPCCCPMSVEGCEWKGRTRKLYYHLINFHQIPAHKCYDIKVSVDINDKANLYKHEIVLCMRRQILVLVKKQFFEGTCHQMMVLINIIMLSSKEDAQNYRFRFTVDGMRERLTWEGVPMSIENYGPDDSNIILYKSSIKQFIENEKLEIEIFIHKP